MALARSWRPHERQHAVRPGWPGLQLAKGVHIGRGSDEILAAEFLATFELQAELATQDLPNH
jgi:hypothetical protein